MDELLADFLTETNEALALLDVELVRLEQDANDPALLSNIFRMVHTIKGTCGFLGLGRLEAVAHAGENILGVFRDGKLTVTPHAVSLILECLDQIRWMVGELGSTGVEPAGDDQALIDRLNACAEGRDVPAGAVSSARAAKSSPAAAPVAASPFEGDEDLFPVAAELLAEAAAAEAAGVIPSEVAPDEPRGPIVTDDEPFPVAAELMAEAAAAEAAGIEPDEHAPDNPSSAPLLDASALIAALPPAEADAGSELERPSVPQINRPGALESAQEGAEAAARAAQQAKVVTPQSIRVGVDVLEELMTLVGELVLTRNQLLQISRSQETDRDNAAIAPALQRLNQVVGELQDGVMKTRMQPIGSAWAKLPRIVRDLSLELGKKIDLVMKGEDTELDRQVLELIKDPLTHMVRNSADHGIESRADRQMMGKPETGTITLNAFHEGGQIIIQISDDGKGLDVRKIKAKALREGVASEAELEDMSEQQIHQLIFAAGFSTADKVTNVSGRGVGMDVVRTNIEKIGGTIDLDSKLGQGTTFSIKIPLTLAIVQALIVDGGGQRFAIPQLSVIELVRSGGERDQKIETINGARVMRLRDRLLPLISLPEVLGLPCEDGDTPYVVVAQAGAQRFGVMVNRVFDTEEIVVKPMSPVLSDISVYGGTTILGDGSVVMIMDPNGLASHIEAVRSDDGPSTEMAAVKRRDTRTSLLLVKAGAGAPKALPLALVSRLEDLDLSRVERSDGRPVVQYNERLMPLVALNGDTAAALSQDRKRIPMVVFSDRDRSLGLIVEEILDIVEAATALQLQGERPGVLGSTVIEGQSTDLVDVAYYVDQVANRTWTTPADSKLKTENIRVLLVDDSPFFLGLVAPFLRAEGHEVITANGGRQALEILAEDEDIQVLVTDIEMPEINGIALARKVRADGRLMDMPIIAVSGHQDAEVLAQARAAGMNDYVPKFDRQLLKRAIDQVLEDVQGAA